MRKVSARVLEREGYEVQTAKDGLDALEHVHERLPDVILLDLEMPRMDGYEFAGYMRNDPRFREVPIVVITSRVGEKHRARAFELGVNRYLGKPYQEADMLSAVTELLAERRAANER
jgi:chemosensory pili system protein ChpA (sensor histidine kinase/response regulator)